MVRIDVDKNPDWDIEWDKEKKYEIYRGNTLLGKLVKEEPIKKKNVIDIIESSDKYFIPSYQRGYRWSDKQVIDLLNDIWNWGEEKQKEQYSLQPIVIKDSDRGIEIVDGQQRLTTIFIILKAIDKEANYSLTYETRSQSAEFLNSISQHAGEKAENIDYHYFINTYNIAINYFKEKEHDAEKWFNYLTDTQTGAFFIEYNTSQDSRNAEQIFTSLNAGKIPLTNAELVKGLFLKKSNFSEKYLNERIEIAQEWDRIEKRLQEENFWAWLGQELTDKPRIELILDIVAGMKSSADTRESFFIFQEDLLGNDKSISELWLDVKKCFMTFEDWYDNSEMYHYLGFLSLKFDRRKHPDKSIVAEYYQEYKKNDGKISFKDKIKDIKSFTDFDVNSLDFEKNSPEIIDWLLLFNILTCIGNGIQFNFAKYQKTNYDLEHIYPHSEFEKIDLEKEREDWLESIRKSQLLDDIFKEEPWLENSYKNKDEFDRVYKKIIRKGNSKGFSEVNRIGNLCLLDSGTNRSYGNKPFPYKFQEIMKVDTEQSKYILPATKNVFLKYYSGLNINNYIWSNDDADKYEEAISDQIGKFIGDVND